MPSKSRLQVGPYTVDLHRRTATNGDGTALPLRWRHFEALKALAEANHEVVSKEVFFERLWPGQAVVDESNLTQCISQLRKALANGHGDAPFIETVPRVGYRLVVPIHSIPDTEAGGDANDRGLPEAPANEPVAFREVAAGGPSATSARWSRPALAAAAVVLVVSGVAIGWRLQPIAQPLTTVSASAAARQRGEDLFRRGDAEAAVQELQRAVQLDPTDANAYATLAHALNRLAPVNSVARPPGQSASLEAAARSVALDPSCGGCQGTLGFYLFYHDWQWQRAETHLREAIRLEPSRASIRPSYALLLVATGRAAEALEEIEFALARQPYEVGWHAIRASILYVARRYPEAVEAADKGLAVKDTERGPWEWKSKALFQMGRGADAIKALAQQAFAQHSSALDRAVQESGPSGGLRTLLEATGDWRMRSEQSWRRIAWRALLDDEAGALDELERAYELRNVNLMYLGVDPVYDRIRSRPRFQKVLTDMGLAQAIAASSTIGR